MVSTINMFVARAMFAALPLVANPQEPSHAPEKETENTQILPLINDQENKSVFKIDLVNKPSSMDALMKALNGEGDELERITGRKVFVISSKSLEPIAEILQTDPYSFNMGNEVYLQYMKDRPGLEKELYNMGSPVAALQQFINNQHPSPVWVEKYSDNAMIVHWDDENLLNYKHVNDVVGFGENGYPEFPGTDDELRALFLLHELEHGMVRHDVDFKLNPLANATIKRNEYHHAGEIEADLSMVTSSAEIVSQESLDWFIDMRNVMSTCYACNCSLLGVKNTTTTHDTAAFLKEFQCTGELPEYREIEDSLNSFYDKITLKCREAFEGYSTIYPIPLHVLADVVREGLMEEPCLFEGGEISVAQHFMDSMDNLDVAPSPLSPYVDAKQAEMAPQTAPQDSIPDAKPNK